MDRVNKSAIIQEIAAHLADHMFILCTDILERINFLIYSLGA